MPGSRDEFDDAWDLDLDLDESALEELNQLEARGVSNAPAAPVASTSRVPYRAPQQQPVNAFERLLHAQKEKVNAVVKKKWDRTAFAKSAAQRTTAAAGKGKGKGTATKGKGKGKGRATEYDGCDDDDDEEVLDYSVDINDPLYDPEEAAAPPKPMKLQPDREACKTFVYPLNKPLRKYQYDIVARALYTDTLVALPTGLGKTFLAAVVMYNFYRWFPKGKIIFMAPSRPLVTQQISACHGIVGIPLHDAVEMTGKDAPEKRQEEWERRRVFYCTPQTVHNDLVTGKLDPTDVICLVIDEAHRGTGEYAYTGVVRFMMQKNPHFRVLALTATPGSNAEVVQAVIDNLHIGNIEVRTDESFDIRPYIHTKKVDLMVIPVQGELGSIRERFGGLMDILIKPLKDVIKTQRTDPTTMHPYIFQAASRNVGSKKWAYPVLAYLGAMARANVKLLEQSVSAFYEALQDLKTSAKGKMKEIVTHPNFASIMRDTEDIVNGRDFSGHPKMVKLKEVVLEHFAKAKLEGTLDSTRIMVFCSFRQVVEEIVDRLNKSSEIRATRLVGQGGDTKGKKGLKQKEQNQVLADFKKGAFNVLVATSIGEEGLDIGELDLIVCYEAPKSSVRTLQRAGRTGRARDGRVIVLMTEGVEEDNWRKANDTYKGVQNAIVSGKLFELYADSHRLVPADIRPVANKVELVIEPFDPEGMGIGSKGIRGAHNKRKRGEEGDLDVFDDGFQKASGRKLGQSTKSSTTGKITAFTKSRAPQSEVELYPLAPELQDHTGKLSQQERREIARYSITPDIQNAQPGVARHGTLPSKLPSSSTLNNGKRFVSSSTRTSTIIDVLRQGKKHSADQSKFRDWEDKLRSDLRWDNVNRWHGEDGPGDEGGGPAASGRDKSFRIGACRIPTEDRHARIAPTTAYHTVKGAGASSRGASSAIADDIGVLSEDDDLFSQAGKPLADPISDDDLPDISDVMSPARAAKRSKPSKAPRIADETIEDDEDEDEMVLPAPLAKPVKPSLQAAARKSQTGERKRDSSAGPSNSQGKNTGGQSAASAPKAKVVSQPVVIDLDDDDDDAGEEASVVVLKPSAVKKTSAAPESQRGRVPLVNPPAIEAKINASATVKKVGKDRLSPAPEPRIVRQGEATEVVLDSEEEMYDDLDMDDSALRILDVPSPRAKAPAVKAATGQITVPDSPGGSAIPALLKSEAEADTELMPPPALPSAMQRPTPAVRPPTALAASSIFQAASNMTMDDSPVVARPKAGGRRRIVTGDSSSPDKSLAHLPKRVKLADDSDVVVLSAPRPKGKLVRAADREKPTDAAGRTSPFKRLKKIKPKKLAADGCPFFDLRAINSDDPDSQTDDDEDIDPETTRDREFVDKGDVSVPGNMQAFYRESLMSQANHRFHGETIRPGAYKLRVDAVKRYVAPRRDEEQIEASQYSVDSFCVGDEDDIIYDDEDDGLPTSETH